MRNEFSKWTVLLWTILAFVFAIVLRPVDSLAALLASGQPPIQAMFVDGANIYFDLGDNTAQERIALVSTSGGPVTTVVSLNSLSPGNTTDVRDFRFDSTIFFWCKDCYPGGGIWTAPKTGGNAAYILTGISGGAIIGQDASRLFFYQGFGPPIYVEFPRFSGQLEARL